MSRTTEFLRSRTGVRLAAVTGAAVLCSGLAVPALAHDTAGGTATTHHHQLSFAEQKGHALRLLAGEARWLTGLKAKVAGDDRLTADQRSRFVGKIDAALSRIAKAKQAVAASDTRREVRAALASVAAWPGRYPRHHRAADLDGTGAATAKLAGTHRSVTVRRAGDPTHRCDGRWGSRDAGRDTRWSGHQDWRWGHHRSGSWDGGDRSGGSWS